MGRRKVPWRLLGVLVVLGAISGTGALLFGERAPGEGPPIRITFLIDGTRYSIELPRGAGPARYGDPPGSAIFELGPSARTPWPIRLGPSVAAGASWPEGAVLAPGISVSYGVDRGGGGSGGEEVFLSGEIVLWGERYALSCHAQNEMSVPEPDWCLTHLATIREGR